MTMVHSFRGPGVRRCARNKDNRLDWIGGSDGLWLCQETYREPQTEAVSTSDTRHSNLSSPRRRSVRAWDPKGELR